MNSPSDRDDARLDALLRQTAPTLPDDGFSTRVLAALPPPPGKSLRGSRTPLCYAAAALGTLVALIGSSAAAAGDDTWTTLAAAFAPAVERLVDPPALAALLVATASALYALRPSLRRLTS